LNRGFLSRRAPHQNKFGTG